MSNKKFIKNCTAADLDLYFSSINEKKFRTKQIFEAIYLKQISSFDKITVLPIELRKKLDADFELNSLEFISYTTSSDFSQKFLFKTYDGHFIETVFLSNTKNSGTRNTICISTMIGCPLGCSFCATAKLGFTRNLNVSEILDQIILITQKNKTPVDNIVIMGMGEPLLNFQNILQSLEIIINNKICRRKSITLSTAGISKKIIEFADSEVATKIALSLHSPQDKIRKMLMPAAEKIEDVCNALEYYYHKTKLAITFEYLLINGLNNNDDDIKKLIKLTRRFPSKINLIPYNDISFTGVKNDLVAASPEQIQEFAAKLKSAGVIAIIRNSQGEDIEAACGQLAFGMNPKNRHI